MIESFLEKSGSNAAVLRHNTAGLSRSEDSDWDIAVRDREQARVDAASCLGGPLVEVRRQYVC